VQNTVVQTLDQQFVGQGVGHGVGGAGIIWKYFENRDPKVILRTIRKQREISDRYRTLYWNFDKKIQDGGIIRVSLK
jgi:hypothetical protein